MSVHPLFPVLGFHSRQAQRLARVPILAPMLVCVLEGEKRVGLSIREWVCPAGHWLVLPAGQEVEVFNGPDPRSGHYRAWCHSVPRDWLARWRSQYGALLPSPLPPSAPVFVPSAAANEAFARFRALAHTEASPWQAVQVEHAWQGVMLALAGDGDGAALFASVHGSVREQVLAALAFDPARAWRASEMAERLAMSTPTLRRRLAEEGTSFSALLADIRMERALALVGGSAVPLLQVAEACGYASPSRFSAAFRARFGVVPSLLRQAG